MPGWVWFPITKQKRPSPDFVPRSVPLTSSAIMQIQREGSTRGQATVRQNQSILPSLHLLLRQGERPGLEPIVFPKPRRVESLSRSLPGLPVVQ